MLANPAINVTPTIAGRESRPRIRPIVANVVSYSPSAMPTPSTVQAPNQCSRDCAAARATSPINVTSAPAIRIGLPPLASMNRPIRGAHTEATSSDHENAANSIVLDAPRLSDTAPNMVAGI